MGEPCKNDLASQDHDGVLWAKGTMYHLLDVGTYGLHQANVNKVMCHKLVSEKGGDVT